MPPVPVQFNHDPNNLPPVCSVDKAGGNVKVTQSLDVAGERNTGFGSGIQPVMEEVYNYYPLTRAHTLPVSMKI